jgi:hypothetical protein
LMTKIIGDRNADDSENLHFDDQQGI